MQKKKKIMAISLVMILMLCLTACENKGNLGVGTVLSDNENDIQKYLEEINKDNDDVNRLLTENIKAYKDDKAEHKIIEKNANNTVISHKELQSEKKQIEKFSVDCSATGKVYPGAILFANKKVLHGDPALLDCKELPRSDLDIIMISGKKEVGRATVKSLDSQKVGEEIKNLAAKNTSPALNKTSVYAEAWSDGQVKKETGIYNASSYFGLDYSKMLEGKSIQMIAVFDNTYYTVKTHADSAERLFDSSIKARDLKDHGLNRANPSLLEVSSVDYGKRYVVTLSSNNSDVNKVLAQWKNGIRSDGISRRYDYDFEDTKFKVYEFSSKGYDLIKETDNLDEVNNILHSEAGAANTSSLMPLRYGAEVIFNRQEAVGNITTDYYSVKIENKPRTHVKIETANTYATKESKFYARRIVGIDKNNGEFVIGPWKCLVSGTSGDKDFYVDSDYAEYGYAFNIVAGTKWPYSDCFWKQENGFAKDITIEMGGMVRRPTIKIDVNNKTVFEDNKCKSHTNTFEK